MAGRIAANLAAEMRRSVRPGVIKLRDFVQGRPSARKQLAEIKSIENLVAAGHDPLHAAYLHGQNYLSVFGEFATRLSEFERYRAVVVRAEEAYVPGWPPISPVSILMTPLIFRVGRKYWQSPGFRRAWRRTVRPAAAAAIPAW
jgi:hypothetical protein